MIALMLLLVILPGAAGDLLNSAGMKRQGEIRHWRVAALAREVHLMLINPYVLVGIPAMAVSFFALMALLSVTTMSYAVPMTAASYIVETALAKYLLREAIDWHRWVGVLLVVVGVAVLSW